MRDTISRQGAIDELVRWDKISDYNDGERNMIACCIAMLSALPSAQPGWIPTSERLPERYDNYLITTKDEDTDIGTFHPEFKQWSICDADGFRLTDGVLAWCELPTPYREGGQDGKN